jgi:peroxiredoxin
MKELKTMIAKAIGTALLLLFAITGYAQSYNTTIQGTIEQMKPGTRLFYQWYDKDHLTPDFASFNSVLSEGNKFTIKLNVNNGEGNELMLMIGSKLVAGKLMFLYVDKGLITINTKDSLLTNITLGGSLYARELNQFHQALNGISELANYDSAKNDVYKARVKKDEDAMKIASVRLKQLDSTRKVLSLAWIGEHPNSPVSVFIMHNVYEPLAGKLTNNEKQALLGKLTPYAKNNKIAAAMEYTFNIDKIAGIGKIAPDFTQNDTLGKPVSLKDFRGRYVLLDFWASWCGPCRKENPNVVKAFNKYKDKGFTVLSVSLDQPGKKEAWLKAIHDDHLTWTHVSDLKFWANAVVKLYDINAVPANFLIGPDGTILAKNVRGEDLEKELAKVLTN